MPAVKYEPWAVRDNTTELWGVKILEGEFDGVALSFNDFDTKENNQMMLDYTVFQVPEGKTKEQIEGPAFDVVLHDIVLDILEKALEHENRNRNSAESSE